MERIFTTPPTILDIATGLSTVPRWTGQTVLDLVGSRWSVLQHSKAGMELLDDPVEKLVFALHDAEEFVTGDTPKPYKSRGQSELGDQVRSEIFQGLGIPPNAGSAVLEAVKAVDEWVRVAEAYLIAPPDRRPTEAPDPAAVDIVWRLIGIPNHVLVDWYVTEVEELLTDKKVQQFRRMA
jgi:hypothetical protein